MPEKQYKKLKEINSNRHDHEHVITDQNLFKSDDETEYNTSRPDDKGNTKNGRWEKGGRLIDF